VILAINITDGLLPTKVVPCCLLTQKPEQGTLFVREGVYEAITSHNFRRGTV
jgi:hypothetical protein